MITTFFTAYLLAFARLDILEADTGGFNHMLSFRDIEGHDILLNWKSKDYLGLEGDRVWIHVHDMECHAVKTSEEAPTGAPLSGTVWLCTAKLVREDK